MLLEVIATSADDCTTAQAAGADRIELCCALALGGLTPSAALVQRARAATTPGWSSTAAPASMAAPVATVAPGRRRW